MSRRIAIVEDDPDIGPMLSQALKMEGFEATVIKDGRLALEVDLIQTLADDLNTMLMNRDPLSQPVHHSKTDVLALFLKRFPAFALMRLTRSRNK